MDTTTTMNASSAQQKLSQSQLLDVVSSETSMARRSFSLPMVNSGTMRPTAFYAHPSMTQQQSSMGIVSPLTYHPQSSTRTVSTDRGINGSLPSIHEQHLNPVSPTPSNGMSNYVWNSHTNSFSSVNDSVMTKDLLQKHPPNAQMKHDRNSEMVPSHMAGSISVPLPFCTDDPTQQQYASAAKKQRPNGYIAPKQIPDSFTSRVGSHVVGGGTMRAAAGSMNATGSHQSNVPAPKQVGLRRQLSSGKIECFLNGDNHDSMDVETAETRPRSMSF